MPENSTAADDVERMACQLIADAAECDRWEQNVLAAGLYDAAAMLRALQAERDALAQIESHTLLAQIGDKEARLRELTAERDKLVREKAVLFESVGSISEQADAADEKAVSLRSQIAEIRETWAESIASERRKERIAAWEEAAEQFEAWAAECSDQGEGLQKTAWEWGAQDLRRMAEDARQEGSDAT